MLKNKIRLLAFFIAIITLGFMRDFVFVQTNLILYNKVHATSYEVAFPINGMNSWDYSVVYYLKYLFTLLCVLSYLFLSHLILHYLFKNPGLNQINLALFILVFVVSGIIFCVGLLTNETEKIYNLSRELLGFIQSPLPLMLLIPIGILIKKDQNI